MDPALSFVTRASFGITSAGDEGTREQGWEGLAPLDEALLNAFSRVKQYGSERGTTSSTGAGGGGGGEGEGEGGGEGGGGGEEGAGTTSQRKEELMRRRAELLRQKEEMPPRTGGASGVTGASTEEAGPTAGHRTSYDDATTQSEWTSGDSLQSEWTSGDTAL